MATESAQPGSIPGRAGPARRMFATGGIPVATEVSNDLQGAGLVSRIGGSPRPARGSGRDGDRCDRARSGRDTRPGADGLLVDGSSRPVQDGGDRSLGVVLPFGHLPGRCVGHRAGADCGGAVRCRRGVRATGHRAASGGGAVAGPVRRRRLTSRGLVSVDELYYVGRVGRLSHRPPHPADGGRPRAVADVDRQARVRVAGGRPHDRTHQPQDTTRRHRGDPRKVTRTPAPRPRRQT